MGGKNPKSFLWNDEVKATMERKETSWKKVLETRDEVVKQISEVINKERERLKGVYIRVKRR